MTAAPAPSSTPAPLHHPKPDKPPAPRHPDATTTTTMVAATAPKGSSAVVTSDVALSASTALFYAITSTGLVFINKWAFLLFPLTNFVLLLQLLLTLAVFAAQRAVAPVAAFPAWDGATARSAAPLSGGLVWWGG